MKSLKYNDCITHINNRLKQETLPIQYLTAGAATLPSMHNVFSQTLHNHYAYFLNYYAKNVTQSLRRHYANIIKQDICFTHTLRNTFTPKLRKNYASITQIVYAKYADITQILYAVITQLSPFYAIILRRNYAEITQNKLRIHYAFYAIITQMNYADIRK